MATATKAKRRSIEHQSLEEFWQEVEQLAAGPVTTVGNWSFPQILRHLRMVIIASLEGFPIQFPWILRRTAGPVMKWYVLRHPMPAGFKAPKSAQSLMPSEDVELPQEIRALRAALDRYRNETPIAEHPIFGKMSQADWDRLHNRHNALHMSFVLPGTEESQPA